MQPPFSLLVLLPIVLPVLFWAAYHYYKDRHLPEPPQNLLLCFCLGLLAALISKGLYAGLEPLGLRYDAYALGRENPLGLLAFALLAIGPIEELAKLLPFLIVVIRLRDFDEPLDGIIYASFIALGYSAAENYHYLDYLTFWEAVARGFAAPAVHILFASIWAHRTTTAVLEDGNVVKATSEGFILAALAHGFYDFLVLLHPYSALPIGAGVIAALWIWRLRLMNRLHAEASGAAKDR